MNASFIFTQVSWMVIKLLKTFCIVKVWLQVQRFKTCVRYTDTVVCENNLDWRKCMWRQYRRCSLYIRLLWRTAGTHMKKISWCTVDLQHKTHGRPRFKAHESSTEPTPGKCVESDELQGDTKKRELLKNPTKIEEIQEKKNYWQKLNHYNLPFKRQ